MKDISEHNWDVIIPRLTSSSRKLMILLGLKTMRRRTPRFRCSSLVARRDYQYQWQKLVDRTLRNTLFEGDVVMDTPTSAHITIRFISQTEMNERRRNRPKGA